MSDIERYLRRATKGTWGRKRADIREELAAHIHERVQVHRLGGLGEAEAVEKALGELGEAGEVSAGMMRLHSMPTLLGSSFLCIAALAFVLTSFSGSVAQQLNGSFIYPARDCSDVALTECETAEINGTFWVSEDALNKALGSQGGDIRTNGDIIRIGFPDGKEVYPSRNTGPVYDKDGVSVKRKEGSINFWDILAGSAKKAPDVEISVSGWERISVGLGELDLSISDGEMGAQKFYESYLYALLIDKFLIDHSQYFGSVINTVERNVATELLNLSVATPFSEGEVYGLINVDPPRESLEEKIEIELSIARSDANGQLEFPNNTTGTTFLNRLPYEPKLEENISILIKLSGGEDGTWYETIPPEAITVN